MVRSSIKEAFLTEPKFTKFIADNEDVAARLLEAVRIGMGDDTNIVAEDRTVDGKRVDLTINDSEGTTVAVIEAQDATGWLDSVHASKISYYCYDKDCTTAVLLCEDASEHIKGFMKYQNETGPLDIWIVRVAVYKTDTGPFVDFYPTQRPFELKEKISKRSSTTTTGRHKFMEEACLKLEKDNPKLFTNVTKYYVAIKDIIPDLNMGLHPRVNKAKLSFYHAGKLENDEGFKNMMIKHGEDNNIEPHFTKTYCNFSFDDTDKALENFKIFKEGS
jgi:hypothetical protein